MTPRCSPVTALVRWTWIAPAFTSPLMVWLTGTGQQNRWIRNSVLTIKKRGGQFSGNTRGSLQHMRTDACMLRTAPLRCHHHQSNELLEPVVRKCAAVGV